MVTVTRLIIVISISILSQLSIALDLPTPPTGFEWVEAPEIKGAFLKPNYWHFKKHKQGEIKGYFITKENIDEKGSFTTGVTINVIPGIPEKTNVSPTQFAAAFIKEASDSRKIIKTPWRHSMGPFNAFGVVLQNSDPIKGDYNTHNLVISNDQTGTVYMVIYEAPVTNWETSRKTGEVILGKLFIDSDI